VPIINVPLPSMPGNTVLIKTVLLKQQVLNTDAIFSDHWFIPTITAGAFNIATAAVDALNQWVFPTFTNTLPSDMNNLGFWLFANIGAHKQSQFLSPSWTGRQAPTASLGPMFKIRFAKRGFFGSAVFITYGSFPPVAKGYITQSKLNSGGLTVYENAMNGYVTPWNSQGWTFSIACVSAAHAITVPVAQTRIIARICTCRKSRIKDPSHRYQYRWPLVP